MSDDFDESGVDASTLVDLLSWRGLNQPTRLAYTFLLDGEKDEVHLTYGELDRRARSIAAQLQRIAEPGERALLLYPPGLDFISAFFGCLYAAVVAVPAYPPRPNRTLERLECISLNADATVALTLAPILSKIQSRLPNAPELADLRWLTTSEVSLNDAEQWRTTPIDDNSLAFLQFTSGSTGEPKGVMVSHANLMHNEHLIRRAFRQSVVARRCRWSCRSALFSGYCCSSPKLIAVISFCACGKLTSGLSLAITARSRFRRLVLRCSFMTSMVQSCARGGNSK
jgi:acyl-CoA synthetase (AMP-forming)/AMP-acid ligase II